MNKLTEELLEICFLDMIAEKFKVNRVVEDKGEEFSLKVYLEDNEMEKKEKKEEI